MNKTWVVLLKESLAQYLINLSPNYRKNSRINEICDDLLSHYIAFSLNRIDVPQSPFDFLLFIKNNGILDPEILSLIEDNTDILNWLLNHSQCVSIKNSNQLAIVYQYLKSVSIDVQKERVISSEDLAHRKSMGVFYTPDPIIKFIIEQTITPIKSKFTDFLEHKRIEDAFQFLSNLKIIDIACGTGSFLVQTIQTLTDFRNSILNIYGVKSFEKFPLSSSFLDETAFKQQLLTQNIFGVDIDPNAVLLSRYNLLTQQPDSLLLNPLIKNIKIGNSLTGSIFGAINGSLNTDRVLGQPIYWSRDFPEVFNRSNPGFDMIITNPPYGKVRFESYKGPYRNKRVQLKERERIKKLAEYFRKSKLYSTSLFGVLNYYKLMIERAQQLLRQEGNLGFIAPNTLLCDLSTTKIRKQLFNEMETTLIVQIPEKSAFFETVTQAFCILIASKTGKTKTLCFKGQVQNENELLSNEYIHINLDFIRRSFPDTLFIPITDSLGLSIFQKLHSLSQVREIKGLKNLRGEVDLTQFASLLSDNPRFPRMLRGCNIEYFHLNLNTTSKKCHINYQELQQRLSNSPKLKHIERERLVCKQIANLNKARRLEFSIVPPHSILANSCNYLLFETDYDPQLLRLLLGIFNSAVLEWRFRITSSNNHINNYELDDLPLLIPATEDPKRILVESIVTIASQLENNSVPPISLQLDLDYLVSRLYNLSVHEIEYILRTLKRSEEYISALKTRFEQRELM